MTITINWDEFVAAAIKTIEPQLGPNLTLDPKTLYAYKYGNYGEVEDAFAYRGKPTSVTFTLCPKSSSPTS